MPRLAVAVIAAAILVAGAPFVGQIRGAIRSAFPNQYRLIIGGLIALAAGAAVVTAIRRIRDRRLFRYGAIAAALGGAVSYIAVFRTGNPDVDVVEAFHLVEYGLITHLFYRVWRDRDDGSTLLVPVLAATVVGVLDEWMQWFVPARVGEIADVWLNAAAIGCGLLFSIGLDPPAALGLGIGPRSRALVATACALTLSLIGVFVAVVHLGHEVEMEDGGVFLSRFSADELSRSAADRVSRWRSDPPTTLRRLSREDQYLAEGMWHIQRRNDAWEDRDIDAAFHENAILERFFAPVIDTPSYSAPAVSRWPEGQRRDAKQRAADVQRRYVSHANPFPIVTWPRPVFLVGVALIAAAVAILCLYNAPRRRWEAL